MSITWTGIPQVEPKAAHGYTGGVLLDVREPSEVNEVSIVGVRNVPMSEMNKHADDKTGAWLAQFQLKPEDGCSEKSPIFVTCKGGVRGQKMCELLASCGKTHVANISGGMMNWEKTMPADTIKRN
eukprot:TRINITY_DN926_c0_g1_i2.p2 TRINITY_DN926_c0_g1~~TRINITY_DN926_c0_g1_i2.p2  ORF type:complete len:126 (+),score=34.29 TRINITY_DN926_c0_g1_i2:56-433(+)